MTDSPRRSSITLRLTAAFVTVAVAAVVVFAALVLASARDQVATLLQQEHRADTQAAAAAAARAYAQAGGWGDADITSAAAIAAQGQANLVLRDDSGAVIAAPAHEAAEMMVEMHGVAIVELDRGEPVTAPVVVDGRQVGLVELRFPASHIPAPQRQIRDALYRNAVLGALLAIVAAVAVAIFVARRVSRPIASLTEAAAKIEAGDRSARVGLSDAPGEIGTLAAAFDRMAKTVEHEDRLRRQLLADVAHEVRTPLTILRGTTEALLDGIADPDASTLGSIHEEVLRLTSLVGDIETLAAADAAGLHLEPELVDLADIARALVDLARPATDAATLQLDTDLEPAPTTADPARLRQVVTTLLANALAYTPSGGHITIRTRTEGDAAVAEVADNGPGIEPNDLPHIFDRFYRGTSSAGTSGSGIGLAVARELTEAHGGTITATNRPEGGASLHIQLPSTP
ncbi:MAG: HAMP domain-containing histidine kinase [Acidimicrobiia bacterium]|nr:HAMP domain-containing histidine kinase [Acidimicrobiia bacterium]